MVTWTQEDGKAAAAEGWGIFEVMGSEYGPYMFQTYDDDKFADDGDVMRHIYSSDKPLHVHARAAMREMNPLEWFTSMRYMLKRCPEIASRPSLMLEHATMILLHGDMPEPA